ncbi:MAG: ATP-grasp domain-containing protein [Ignavibacterium sp.]|nr:ATP-grasp domain-containing protein [Ignavibacterium sp.]
MDNQKNKIDVLLTNAWDRIGYNVLRGLAGKGLNVALGTDNYLGMAYYSHYCSAKFIHSNYKLSEKNFIEDVTNAIQKFQASVYIPTGEEVFAVSRNLEHFKNLNIKIPVSDINTLEKLNNKILSYEVAKSAEVPVPDTIVPQTLDEIISFIKQSGRRAVIKKGWSRSAQGVFILNGDENENVIRKMISGNKLEFGKFIVQRYVSGETYGVSLLMNKGEPRAIFTHKRLREIIKSGGPSTLRVSTKNHLLEEYAVKLLSRVKFHGVAMIEFKYDERTKQAWFIEVNPRFWGSVGLAVNAGVNFPYFLYKMAINGDVEPVLNYREGIKAKWLLGDISAITKNIFSVKTISEFKKLLNAIACAIIIYCGGVFMSFGDIVKAVRMYLGITQEQLARDLNISFSTINRWENGRTIPSRLAKMRFVEYCLQRNVDNAIIAELKDL